MRHTICAGLLAGGLFFAGASYDSLFATVDPATKATSASMVGAVQLSHAFQEVSAKLGPAIVSIETIGVSLNRWGRERRGQMAQGSGVVVREDGVVLTNNHVVEGGEEFRVVFGDDRKLEAKLLGTDEKADLAVLKIESSETFPFAEIAGDREAQVGEWVLAMGNPKGIGHTVTAGIVSAVGRNGLGVAEFEDFIQTDAAINPGNSGGPLVDLDGRIIGINTAIARRDDGTEGISFSIPSRWVEDAVEDILEFGRVRRGLIGIEREMRAMSRTTKRRLGYEGKSLVRIAKVTKDGPAERAGIRRGDVVDSIDGRQLVQFRDLLHRVLDREPGESMQVRVFRDGEFLEFDVTLDERDPETF